MAEPPEHSKEQIKHLFTHRAKFMPSFKEYRYSSVLKYKLIELIYLQMRLLTYHGEKRVSFKKDYLTLSAKREQQHMNGGPEIKCNSIFVSSLLEPRLESLFHTNFILLAWPFL